MSTIQIVCALLGFGLMSWAMAVTKQYALVGAAMVCWAVVVLTQLLFGTQWYRKSRCIHKPSPCGLCQ